MLTRVVSAGRGWARLCRADVLVGATVRPEPALFYGTVGFIDKQGRIWANVSITTKKFGTTSQRVRLGHANGGTWVPSAALGFLAVITAAATISVQL